jgi:hypothetical protein
MLAYRGLGLKIPDRDRVTIGCCGVGAGRNGEGVVSIGDGVVEALDPGGVAWADAELGCAASWTGVETLGVASRCGGEDTGAECVGVACVEDVASA